MRYRIIAGLAAAIVVADQLTKWLVTTYLSFTDEVVVTTFFSLVHVRNRGAAFGFLNDPAISWQFWLFAVATVIAMSIVFYIAKSAKDNEYALFTALGCIAGGAIGNFIDRARFREVIDFLDFHLADMHWPAFNVADIAICIGAVLTVMVSLRPGSEEKRKEHD